MIIDDRHLVGLRVVTRAGRVVGQIKRVHINVDTHTVVHYIVGQGVLPNVFGNELLISPSQVLSISNKVMTILDGGELSATDMAAAID